ncbi:hypothetical protein [Burkholderia aenigmatica]|uniref:hypothetical protein n=1 Tax=Burkholderia aenigmatica TaxID=2015348 RepID=UPI0015C65F9A|nr:hypothetical protein [Burkholderia aenigmatica]
MKSSAISIICCDRYDYFKATFDAVLSGENSARPIFVFQDFPKKVGGVEKYNSISNYISDIRARQPDLEIIHIRSSSNLGIAVQWHRAMNYPLDYFGYDAVYVFEDDLVVQPHYVATMDVLLNKFRHDGRVGTFSCFNAAYRGSEKEISGFSRMGHDWGFGITKDVWLEVRPYFEEYIELLQNRAYSDRQATVVQSWLESLGFRWKDGREGCDSVFEYIIAGLGRTRVCTVENLLTPIGAEGAHFTDDYFKKLFSDLAVSDFAGLGDYTDDAYRRIFESHLIQARAGESGPMLESRRCRGSSTTRFNGVATKFLYFEGATKFFPGSSYISKKQFGDDWVLKKGRGTLYGPYVKIEEGQYLAIVLHEGAAKLTFKVTHSLGTKLLESTSREVSVLSEKVVTYFEFGVSEPVHDLELVIDAETSDEFKVEVIELIRYNSSEYGRA